MNPVDNLLKLLFRHMKLEEQLEITKLSPHQPLDIIISQKDDKKQRTLSLA